ncbi:pseudouridine synthase [Dyadobacter frigoris]|uniref:Pseudouridine synthase n=1 Tax=Dyadobacter frigoris TaxID=2576211 RepID=A0A4U6D8G1_9BACT|nr:pseudouridine synthase [Dyadobacter frigoris]TKT93762.1 pseudouridine synthase [Dyadobacter frigoris]GLU51025.1 pseudouridine synthase [Dyadobacter frigoris]
MRKRITKSSDASSSRPPGRSGNASARPFGKKRPEAESRFSKPSIKKSSLRAASPSAESSRSYNDRPSGDKPRFDSERPRYDKPNFGKPGFSKPGFDKPRFDRSGPGQDRPRPSDRDGDSRGFKPRGEFAPRERSEGRSFDKPGFDKPRFERSGSDRPERSGQDRPSFDRPRSSDRDGDSRGFKPRGEFAPRERSEGRSFDKSRFERPAFDKPRSSDRDGDSREFKPRGEFAPRERSEGRSFDKPGSDKPRFERSGSDRARSSDGASREFKPRGEFAPRERSEGRSFDKPGFGKPSFDKSRSDRSSDAPRSFKPREDRPSNGRHEKSDFKKKSDFEEVVDADPTAEMRAIEEAANRRVGRFETAPRYNLSGYDKKPGSKKRKEESSEMRLNRYIANAGICSRREADDLIASGQISVNGKVVTEMGHKVEASDVVKFGKKALSREKLVYVLINKPKDYITTTDDPEERKTVLDLIKGACYERIYPVGRLDRNTTGLLLMTNDGELAEKLTHPSNGIKKIYQAELDKPITTEDFEQLQAGLELEDGFVKPDEVGIVTPDAMVVGLEIHSGKNRIVRRMFEHLGYEVQKLDRTVFAGLDKKELPRGKWRFLSEKEVVRLKFML